jgi:hypothetical protein
MKALKIIYLLIALICVALGTLGIFLPILPTTPLYLLAAFLFTKSSKKLEIWFTNTDIYKKHIVKIRDKKALNIKEKISILLPITILMAIGLFFMRDLFYPRIILMVIWIAHMVYFGFVIKNDEDKAL